MNDDIANFTCRRPLDSNPLVPCGFGRAYHPKQHEHVGGESSCGTDDCHDYVSSPTAVIRNQQMARLVDSFVRAEGNYAPNEEGVYGKLGRALFAWRATERELDRLAGPVCPFDGKRAIEHTHKLGYCRAADGDYRHVTCRKHPEVAEITEWQKQRRRKIS